MAVGDLFVASITVETAGQSGSFGLGLQLLSADDGGDPSGFAAAAVGQSLVPLYAALLSSEVDFGSVQVWPRIAGQWLPGTTAFINVTGDREGDCLPFVNCALVRLFQSAAGAKRNGRQFVPGLAENDTSNGKLDTGTLAAEIAALSNGLVNEISAAGPGGPVNFRPVVIGDFSADPNVPPATWEGNDITIVNVSEVIYRQRRRRSKFAGFGL